MTPAQIILAVKIGLLSLLIAGSFISGHHIGAEGVQAAWDASKVEMIDAQSKLIATHAQEMEDLRKKQNLDNVQVSEDHQKAIDEITKKHDTDLAAVRAAGGLRIPRSICNGPADPGAETPSTSGPNADTAGTVTLPDKITNDLFDYAAEADQVTEQARACQSWIRKNGFYDSLSQP